jgi:hypothetical protein
MAIHIKGNSNDSIVAEVFPRKSHSLVSVVPACNLPPDSRVVSPGADFVGTNLHARSEGGGPFYKTANFNVPKNIAEIEHSGFSEAIVWSVEVNSQGDLNFNGEFPLTSNGVYVGNKTYPKFAADMATLKQAGTVKRVTFSIGSSNYGDWENITALVKAQGVGPKSILYKDFKALKKAIPALDALDFDDENSYDPALRLSSGSW